MKPLFAMSVLSLALTLNACSGGGGGGDSPSNPGTSSSTSSNGTDTTGSSTGTTTTASDGSTGGSGATGGSGGVNDGTGTGTGNGGSGTTTGGDTGSTGGGSGTGGGAGGGGTTGDNGGGTTPANSPQNISNAPAVNAEIAMDANGNAMAVWEQSDGTRDSIYYSRYTVRSGWGTPAVLEDLDVDAKQPAIAMNEAGDALAVWVQPNPTATSQDYWAWARLYSTQTGWGPATIVSNKTYQSYDGPWAATPHAAIDASGIAIALWESSSIAASSVTLTGNVYRPGTGWGTEQFLHRGWTIDADIAMDGHGNAVVGYAHDGGGSFGQEAYAVNYFAASGWGAPHRFYVPIQGGQSAPTTGIDPTGTATAVWTRDEAAAYNADHLPHHKIYFSRRAPTGEWTDPIFLTETPPFPGDLDLAVASNGNAVLSWREGESGAFSVHAARFENGLWQAPVTVGDGDQASVAMAGDGPFMTLLQNNRAMYARYIGPGWSAPAPLDSGTEAASAPRITGSDFATPFFAWLQPSGVWVRALP